MKPLLLAVLAHAALLPGGCATRRVQDDRVGSAARQLAAIDVDPSHYGSDAEYRRHVCDQVRDTVAQTSSASELSQLHYECRRLRNETPATPDDRRSRINVLGDVAPLHVYYRLAALGTDDGAKALVDLFADENLKFGCDHGVSLCSAITRCGKRALPYLAKLTASGRASRLPERRGNLVPQLIDLIGKGVLYNPELDAATIEEYRIPTRTSEVQRSMGDGMTDNE
ncbi:MAG: hypothetical protein ACYTFI_06465 [Planctomycetota bacterium]|jgi:hypothetical protein